MLKTKFVIKKVLYLLSIKTRKIENNYSSVPSNVLESIRLFHLRMFSQQETAANAFSPAMIFIYVAIKLFRAFHFHQCTKTECHLSCVPLSLWLFAFFLPSLLTFTHFIAFYLDHFYRLSYCDILTYRSASYTYSCTWRDIIQLHFNAYKSVFLSQYYLKFKIVDTFT